MWKHRFHVQVKCIWIFCVIRDIFFDLESFTMWLKVFPIQLPGNASDVVLWSHPKSGLSWCVTGSCQETRVSCINACSPFCIVEKRLCCAANILRLRKVLGKVTMSLPKHWISLNHWTCIPKHELPEKCLLERIAWPPCGYVCCGIMTGNKQHLNTSEKDALTDCIRLHKWSGRTAPLYGIATLSSDLESSKQAGMVCW